MPYAVFLPLILACIITVTAHSEFDAPERMAVRRLRLLRTGYLAVGTGLAVCGLLIATSAVNGTATTPAAVRNLLLLTGLGLLSIPVNGARVSWVLPVGAVLLLSTVGARQVNPPPWWNVLLQDDRAPGAMVVAVGTLTLGLLLTALWPRPLLHTSE